MTKYHISIIKRQINITKKSWSKFTSKGARPGASTGYVTPDRNSSHVFRINTESNKYYVNCQPIYKVNSKMKKSTKPDKTKSSMLSTKRRN